MCRKTLTVQNSKKISRVLMPRRFPKVVSPDPFLLCCRGDRLRGVNVQISLLFFYNYNLSKPEMEITGEPVKSSNEILTELFGAFNAEPPKLDAKLKRRSSSDDGDSKHKKSKKSKKSKKKHKSKSKKHKRKRSESSSESESDSDKKKSKKKKKKKRSSSSPENEILVNKVPMALEIMLDGTVGIKGEDGTIKKIIDVENEKRDSNLSDWENDDATKSVNGDLTGSTNLTDEEKKKVHGKTDDNGMLPEVFEEPENVEQRKFLKFNLKSRKS